MTRFQRAPAETNLHLPRWSFDDFSNRSDGPLGARKYGAEERPGISAAATGRNSTARCPVHDPWTEEDLTSSQTDRSRGLRYIHTTNYPDKILMRRAKSVSSLHSNEIVTPGRRLFSDSETTPLRSLPLQTVDRHTQTLINRSTQTPSTTDLTPHQNNENSYYRQLLMSPTGRRSAAPQATGSSSSSDFKLLDAYMNKHGPALYRNGGKGAPWRHLKLTSGISGQNIMFVDGLVKEYDSRYFPSPSVRRQEPEVVLRNGFYSYRQPPLAVNQY